MKVHKGVLESVRYRTTWTIFSPSRALNAVNLREFDVLICYLYDEVVAGGGGRESMSFHKAGGFKNVQKSINVVYIDDL